MQSGSSDRGRSSEPRYRAAAPDATEDFLFHLYRGSELLQDNRVHEAKEELEQALRLQPRDAKGQDLLAVVYFRLGLYPRAIEIYEELMRDFPRDAALAQNLSLCYLKTGQPDKARTLLENLVLTLPDHVRAWSYLGLVHERLGDYEKARAAFERGRQPGMARRMEELLALGAPPRSLSVPPPEPRVETSRAAAEHRLPAEGFHDLDREVSLSGMAPGARISTVPPPKFKRSNSNGSVPAAAFEPLPIVQVPATPVSPPLPDRSIPTTSTEVPTLATVAHQALLAFPEHPGLAPHPSGLVLVRIGDGFAARLSSVRLLLAGPQTTRHEKLLRRMRNRTVEEPLGGNGAPIVLFADPGSCLALHAANGEELFPFRIEDDFLFVREAALVGFDGSILYESGRLAAFQDDAVALVQLRGRGGVVLQAKGPLVSAEVKSERSLIFAREAVLGWKGRLLPRELAEDELFSSAKGLISFAGEGVVLASSAARLFP